MVDYEIIGVTKVSHAFHFEIKVAGESETVWISMSPVTYARLTPDEIADHIYTVLEARFKDKLITPEEVTKLNTVEASIKEKTKK